MSAPRETFDGKIYTFGILPATKALPIGLEIAPVMADAMAELGGASAQAALASEGDRATVLVARGTGALLRRLSPSDWTDRDGRPHLGMTSIMATLFEHVEMIDGGKAKPVTLDSFTGKLSVAKDVFMHALKVNFADFFPVSPSASSHGEPKGA